MAGAVALGPDILILDEPIAQLDPGHADKIYDVLRNLNENYGKTIIVIEHHTEYIADYCKHALLLKNGSVEWILPAREALARVEELQECNIFPPQVTLDGYALEANGTIEKQKLLPTTLNEGKKVFAGLPIASDRKVVQKKNDMELVDIVASFRNVGVSYRTVKGNIHIVYDGLNLDIHRGEKIALIGSNGAGKSTLMKMLVGLLKASDGTVFLNGKEMKDVKPEQLSSQISLVYQNPEDMFIKDSIESDISFAIQSRG